MNEKDLEIWADVKTRMRLQVARDELYRQRIELDARIAATSRQIRRLSDAEIAKSHKVTKTRVRRACGL